MSKYKSFDVPCAFLWRRGGYKTLDQLNAATDDELLALLGVGPVYIKRLRKYLTEKMDNQRFRIVDLDDNLGGDNPA